MNQLTPVFTVVEYCLAHPGSTTQIHGAFPDTIEGKEAAQNFLQSKLHGRRFGYGYRVALITEAVDEIASELASATKDAAIRLLVNDGPSAAVQLVRTFEGFNEALGIVSELASAGTN